MAAVGKQAWFALMNRKSRTAARRSPEQTRPRLLKEYRARMRSDQEPPPPGGPRFGQPGRPTREWSGRLAQTRGLARQDYVQHGRGRPSVGETPANTVDVFLASAAPLARDSGCPPKRVNPKPPLLTTQGRTATRSRGEALAAGWDLPPIAVGFGRCRPPTSVARAGVQVRC